MLVITWIFCRYSITITNYDIAFLPKCDWNTLMIKVAWNTLHSSLHRISLLLLLAVMVQCTYPPSHPFFIYWSTAASDLIGCWNGSRCNQQFFPSLLQYTFIYINNIHINNRNTAWLRDTVRQYSFYPVQIYSYSLRLSDAYMRQ